jgi:type VI protein secretion system component VasF
LENIQKRGETPQTADLLEVFLYCLLLGYKGQFRLVKNQTDLNRTKDRVLEQIRRIRAGVQPPAPWRIEQKSVWVIEDLWIKRLKLGLAVVAILVVIAYVGYRTGLGFSLESAVVALRGGRTL